MSYSSGSRKAGDGTLQIIDSPVEEYIYQLLLPRHIRLLRVTKDLEEFHILHTSIDSAPAYTAVSYTWDGQQRDQDLRVGGSNLRVIENVRAGLPYLIKCAKTQFLWIDGICVNQDDHDEKAVQIPLMQEIYTKCQECLIWLGESTPEAELAIDAIPRITHQLKLHDAVQVWEMEGIHVPSSGVPDSPLWKGFVKLFSRPWFKRVWTFQEAVLPDIVMFLCGNRLMTFAEMEPLALPLLNHLTSLQFVSPEAELGERLLFVGFLKVIRISKFRESSQVPKKGLDTLNLLNFTRPWSVTNPLDKIYGVLGLTDRSLQNYLVVDYHKTDAEISGELTQWYISLGEDLFILNLASSGKKKTNRLPSWMPSFTNRGSHWCIEMIWHRFRTVLDKVSTSRMSASIHLGELHVDGLRIDQVTHVVPYLGKPSIIRAERPRNILEWEEACLIVSKSVFGDADSSVPEAHWTTMISGICDNHIKPTRSEYDLLKSFLKSTAAKERLSPDLEARNQDLSLQIRRLSQSKTFFCTQGGRIGLGPISTQPGDQICIFYKGFTPFIIHPKPELGSKYQFIGDSYTYGLMHGEALQSETRCPDETFVLV
jgi:hypothetical protein